MALTDTACKNAKAKEKAYKISDSGGLYLEIMPSGSKYWRLKYRFLQKEKRLALGVYPRVSLADARDGRENAKKLLAQNIDPVEAKREDRRAAERESGNSFKVVALEWHENQQARWSENHSQRILHRLEVDVFPYIGKDSIAKIEAPDLLTVLRKIEKRGALDIAARTRQICGQIFYYGMQTGKCKANPADALRGALKTRKTKHFDAIEPKEIPSLLEAVERNDARLFARTRRAIKLSMLTFVRPGELRQAQWSEFNFERREWHIPAARMKARKDHIVPLSRQAITLFKEQHEETGYLKTDYVFPSQNSPRKPMSEATVLRALQRMGFKGRMTAHGFRALARTAIREELEYDPDVIEAQLAHKPQNPLGAAYDRAKFMKQRHVMMQAWADYLDAAVKTSRDKVIFLKKRG